jgi:sarcosine oxidase delta subunit
MKMIIECPYCESKIDREVKGEHQFYEPHENPLFKAVLPKCPVCNNVLHATEVKTTKYDAKALLDFAQKICDYVFVLNAKFNPFMERKDNAKPKKPVEKRRRV